MLQSLFFFGPQGRTISGLFTHLCASVLFFGSACAGDGAFEAQPSTPVAPSPGEPGDSDPVEPVSPSPRSILEIVRADPNLSLLSEALELTGLAETLAAPGAQFTLFAPSDSAFQEILDFLGFDTVAELAEEEMDTLRPGLRYHVVESRLMANALVQGRSFVSSLEGPTIVLNNQSTEILVNDSELLEEFTDVVASNGVVHVINDTLYRPAVTDLVEWSGLDVFTRALAATDLGEVLEDETFVFTVLAPTDSAFEAAYPEGLLLETEAEFADFRELMLYHWLQREDARDAREALTVARLLELGSVQALIDVERYLEFSRAANGVIQVSDETGTAADFIHHDLIAINGVLHVIDRVLDPAVQVDEAQ